MINLVKASQYCELRRGCAVESQTFEDDSMIVGYTDSDAIQRTLKCRWFIGADGKKGVVRKKFLEPEAGIKQDVGKYSYEGTWVAANLQITPPTPASHPQLPFWELGMTSDEVCDLYWPKGWHFCTPPGKATACGLFGPYKDRNWRHEFAEPDWHDSMDAEALFWEHITPMITRWETSDGRSFSEGLLMFPRDCIAILRCRPFVFVQKCVNKWFDKRRVLIGDSAHVFPPFGGEGMSSGLRDAHQLAWRITLAEKVPGIPDTAVTKLLDGWEAERKRGISDAVTFTKINGMLCNEPESWGFWVFRHLEYLYKMLPVSLQATNSRTLKEAKGYRGVKGGSFLSEFNGGGKLAQAFVQSCSQQAFRSDGLLGCSESLFTLLVVESDDTTRYSKALLSLEKSHLPAAILSSESMVCVARGGKMGSANTSDQKLEHRIFRTTDHVQDIVGNVSNYSSAPYLDRLGPFTAYALVRPDFYVYALLQHAADLERCLIQLKAALE